MSEKPWVCWRWGGGDAVNSEVLLTAPMSPKGWDWTQGGLSSGGIRDD